MGLDSTETNLQQIKQPFKLLNADMSSTMSGYSPILTRNTERGTLNSELFKPFKRQTLQTFQTLQTA